MKKVSVVVVTYNKLAYLKECLIALENQTYPIESIIVVDNCSTDGTKDFLEQYSNKIIHLRFEENLGGAGGFNRGIKEAYKNNCDYIWIMDDDTIPMDNALEKLMDAARQINQPVGFLCSNVKFVDNMACVMNVPKVSKSWNDFAEKGYIKVYSASFVSVLVNSSLVEKVGFPIEEFFIWGDDVEYTSRFSNIYNSYMVSNSIVIHKMKENKGVDILKEKGDRINRYFFEFRNRFYIAKKKGIKSVIKTIINYLNIFIKIIFKSKDNKMKKLYILLKGTLSGIFFNPKIEKP